MFTKYLLTKYTALIRSPKYLKCQNLLRHISAVYKEFSSRVQSICVCYKMTAVYQHQSLRDCSSHPVAQQQDCAQSRGAVLSL